MKTRALTGVTVASLALATSAQTESRYYRSLTLARVEPASSGGGGGGAGEDENTKSAELAKKLSNPIANLISVPIQNNWDFGIGPANAMRYTANIQPVIPFSITEKWNVITRTILPVIYDLRRIAGQGWRQQVRLG